MSKNIGANAVSLPTIQDNEGKKNDDGKLRYDLVPVEAHEAMAQVFTYGATKYGDNNWQNVDSNRYLAALFRHLNAWRKGEKMDSESGLSHLKHALTNVAILVYKEQEDFDKEMEEMYQHFLKEKKIKEETIEGYFDDMGNTKDI